MGSLLDQYQCIWEPLNIFIVVFSSVWLGKNGKRNLEKHIEIFLEFLVFVEQGNLKRKTKMRKTIYTRELPTSKRRTRKSFWVFFLKLQLIKLGRKNRKEAGNIFRFSQCFLNTQEESEKINLTWIVQWESVDTDKWNVWTWM